MTTGKQNVTNYHQSHFSQEQFSNGTASQSLWYWRQAWKPSKIACGTTLSIATTHTPCTCADIALFWLAPSLYDAHKNLRPEEGGPFREEQHFAEDRDVTNSKYLFETKDYILEMTRTHKKSFDKIGFFAKNSKKVITYKIWNLVVFEFHCERWSIFWLIFQLVSLSWAQG